MNKKRLSKKPSFFWTKIFPSIFILIGIGTFVAGLRNMIYGYQSTDWPQADAVVTKSKMGYSHSSGSNGRSSTAYYADIEYTYEINGTKYQGDDVSFGEFGSSDSSYATETLEKYPKGKKVKVYYNESDPSIAVIEAGLSGGSWFLPIFGLIFMSAGFLVTAMFKSRKFHDDSQRDVDKPSLNDKKALHVYAGDKVLESVSQEKMSSGAASFKSHVIVEETATRIRFGKSMSSKIFAAVFFIIGVLLLIFLASETWIGIVVGSIFSLLGGYLFLKKSDIVFDKSLNGFQKNAKEKKSFGGASRNFDGTRLDDIYALQIITWYMRGGRNSAGFHVYELNLILRNAQRVHVFAHGNEQALRADAQKVADFLDVPLIDQTGN